MKYSIGQNVTLTEGYKGYKTGEIIGYDFPKYEVELSSGKVIRVYEDEIEAWHSGSILIKCIAFYK